MAYNDPAKARAYQRAYYLAHREEKIAASQAYRAADPEAARLRSKRWYEEKGRERQKSRRAALNAYQRAYDAAHPEKVRLDNRTQRLRRLGLTIAQRDAMEEAQRGLCALCGKPETSRGRNGEIMQLAVDHDHATGSIRALLCHSCNTGIGSFYDDPELLVAAAEYVKRWQP